MSKVIFTLTVVAVLFVAETTCWRRDLPVIYPTYRPRPTVGPVTMRAKRSADDEPLWLFKDNNEPRAPSTGDHPVLPSIIDDIKLNPNTRYARSLSTPNKYHGGSHTISKSSQSTGPTHPGYNRRHVRSFDSRSSKHHGGSPSTSSGSKNTGQTHPGYNRRNA
uniref:Lebocin-like protein n=1 Tax=Samia ricini TaxID=63990 RepID=Q5KSY2_SAMRI|nr:lebocin-like protein [Samia ricini]